jgi:hypothetical protein
VREPGHEEVEGRREEHVSRTHPRDRQSPIGLLFGGKLNPEEDLQGSLVSELSHGLDDSMPDLRGLLLLEGTQEDETVSRIRELTQGERSVPSHCRIRVPKKGRKGGAGLGILDGAESEGCSGSDLRILCDQVPAEGWPIPLHLEIHELLEGGPLEETIGGACGGRRRGAHRLIRNTLRPTSAVDGQ